VDVEKVATPDVFTLPIPSTALPFWKVTVPLGVCPAPFTVAENVTGLPAVPGLGDASNVVELDEGEAALMVSCTAPELEL
jgi:hypothetical protein